MQELANLLAPLFEILTVEVVSVFLMMFFVLLFFGLMRVVKHFAGNEQAKQLKAIWEMVDDVIYDSVIEVALSPATVAIADERMADIRARLGHDVDERMAAVLVHVENYIELYVPIDIDLVFLYARAERIYQEARQS